MAEIQPADLEKLADSLLSGERSVEDVEDELRGISLSFGYKFDQDGRRILQDEDLFNLLCQDEKLLASIRYGIFVDSFGEKFSWLYNAESFFGGRGNFSYLYRSYEKFLRDRGIAYIFLEVDSWRDDLLQMWGKFGFEETGSRESIGDNTSRIYMRNDLSHGK